MVITKLINVSLKSGDRFRNNQNYTMVFWKKDGIDEKSTVDDIRMGRYMCYMQKTTKHILDDLKSFNTETKIK